MTTLRIQLPTFRTSAPRGAAPLALLAYRLWVAIQWIVSAGKQTNWADQFNAASLDQQGARDTVNALYRGGSVRL